MVPGMFTNLCLVLLLLLAGSLVPKFHFQLSEKSHKEVPEMVEHGTIWQIMDELTALARLYALYSHRARSFNQ